MLNLLGEPIDSVSVSDRGLQFGDGLFETLRVARSQPLLWQSHCERLHHGCERLKIPSPDQKLLEKRIKALSVKIGTGVIKVLHTRGDSERGYALPDRVKTTTLLGTYPMPLYPMTNESEGVRTILCKTPISAHPILAGIKHLNRLEQVLAANEVTRANADEGLMQNLEGEIIGGTKTNLFFIEDNRLLTPDLSLSGVKGTMRDAVINYVSGQGIVCEEVRVSIRRLQQASTAFVCNSLIGIWPIHSFEATLYARHPMLDLIQKWAKELFKE